MNLNDYIAQRVLISGKVNYFQTLRWLAWGLWVMLVKPSHFEHNGQTVFNHAPNGVLRALGGALLMILTGLLVSVISVLGLVILLIGLVFVPITALVVHLSVLWRAMKVRREIEKRIEAVRHGL